MSFWGKVFGTDKAIESTIDAVKDGLDKLVYTDEERADTAATERQQARAMLVQWMEATQGQNLARRVISLAVTGVWLSQYVVAQLASGIAVFWVERGEQLKAFAKINMDSADAMSPAAMLILGFYFAAPHLASFVEVLTGRMKQKQQDQQ
jgi:hypothetical protein